MSDPAFPPGDPTAPLPAPLPADDASEPQAPPPAPDAKPHALPRGVQIFVALLIILICLQVGFVLLVIPWTPFWSDNYFSTVIPSYFWVWHNPYFKGAISGLGIVNFWIGLTEILRLRRFAKTR